MRFAQWWAVAAMASATLAGAAGLEPESLNGWQFVSDPEISPDGAHVVYVVARFDVDKDTYESDLWVIDGNAEPRPFVTAAGADFNPRWSPQGKNKSARLAFLSARTGKNQIFVLEMAGGEAWQLTKEAEGVAGFAWSPDGARIAYLARAHGTEAAAPAPGRARVTERLAYRSDGSPGFVPEMRPQLWVIDVRTEHDAALGPLTDGSVEPSTPAWSADGKSLVFSALDDPDSPDLGERTELYRVAAERGAVVQRITERDGPDEGPVIALPGGMLAWTGFDLQTPPRSSTSRSITTPVTSCVYWTTLRSTTMSRAQAKRRVWGETLLKEMEERGIVVRAASKSGVAEEAGFAYKSVDEVAAATEQAGLSRRVAQLVPVGNVKG